jgi:hypothetical protein
VTVARSIKGLLTHTLILVPYASDTYSWIASIHEFFTDLTELIDSDYLPAFRKPPIQDNTHFPILKLGMASKTISLNLSSFQSTL